MAAIHSGDRLICSSASNISRIFSYANTTTRERMGRIEHISHNRYGIDVRCHLPRSNACSTEPREYYHHKERCNADSYGVQHNCILHDVDTRCHISAVQGAYIDATSPTHRSQLIEFGSLDLPISFCYCGEPTCIWTLGHVRRYELDKSISLDRDW